MVASEITPLILSWNEEQNLERTLRALKMFPRVILVDSGSWDRTLEIARSFPNVEIFNRSFDQHATQWNYGVNLVATEWVLALDADYLVTPLALLEILSLEIPSGVVAVIAPFKYCVFGRPLRGSLYPAKPVLFKKSQADYIQDGHTQKLKYQGASIQLRSPLWHDDRKSLRQWLVSQDKYAELEKEKLLMGSAVRGVDRIRKWIVVAPILTFFYCLFVKGLIFDGKAGLYYTLQRVVAEIILSLKLLEAGCKVLTGDKTNQ